MNKQTLKNDFLQLEYMTTSLWITGLSLPGGPNLLVDLTAFPPIPTPYGDYYFHGGHRLWHAPEAMPRSYIPENDISVTELSDGVILEGKTEPDTGIRKRIEIRLAADKPSVTLTHTLVNNGLWPVELAPWTITQLRLGGTVVMPMPVGSVDPSGLLPNRHFSFWSYASVNDPRLKLGDRFTFFKADVPLPPFKMGYFNPHGWLAYWLEGVLFRKTFGAHVELTYPDNNCNAEVYCNEQFVELESLSPLGKLAPGASVTHVETWELSRGLDSLPEEAQRAL